MTFVAVCFPVPKQLLKPCIGRGNDRRRVRRIPASCDASAGKRPSGSAGRGHAERCHEGREGRHCPQRGGVRGIVQGWMRRQVMSGPRGPSEEERTHGASVLWGEVVDDRGGRAVSRLRGPESYAWTVTCALAMLVEGLARFGDAEAARGAQQQRHAEPLLELRHGLRDGRLASTGRQPADAERPPRQRQAVARCRAPAQQRPEPLANSLQ